MLVSIITQPHQLMTPQKAEALAEKLQASDPKCSYKAVHDPKGTGCSYVEVRSKDGATLKL